MPLTAIGQQTASFHLIPEPAQVRHARAHAGKAMFEWDLGEHADLAELIVSELVTNAIRHGDGLVQVRMSYGGSDLRIEVHDDGPGRPVRREATAEDDSGRGLALLDGLIGLHGGERGTASDPAGNGKSVYVVIGLTPHIPGIQ
jgi:signal transduction histidine kinase